jgi:hypothetical protein
MTAVRNDRTIRGKGHSVEIGDKHFEIFKDTNLDDTNE